MVPVSLLRPGDLSKKIDSWLDDATRPLKPLPTDDNAFAKLEAFNETKKRINEEITTLRERVTHFNLPYLSLPADTSKDVALQVFINMNTNSKPLSLYDIIVAEVESVAEQSLHALEASLIRQMSERQSVWQRFGSDPVHLRAAAGEVAEYARHDRDGQEAVACQLAKAGTWTRTHGFVP
jgi:hypothetical protein